MRILGTILHPNQPARNIEFDSDWDDPAAEFIAGLLFPPAGVRAPAFVSATYDDGELIVWTLPAPEV